MTAFKSNTVTLTVKAINTIIFIIKAIICVYNGGLGLACWPLVPKFAGSNPAEAVGFLG